MGEDEGRPGNIEKIVILVEPSFLSSRKEPRSTAKDSTMTSRKPYRSKAKQVDLSYHAAAEGLSFHCLRQALNPLLSFPGSQPCRLPYCGGVSTGVSGLCLKHHQIDNEMKRRREPFNYGPHGTSKVPDYKFQRGPTLYCQNEED